MKKVFRQTGGQRRSDGDPRSRPSGADGKEPAGTTHLCAAVRRRARKDRRGNALPLRGADRAGRCVRQKQRLYLSRRQAEFRRGGRNHRGDASDAGRRGQRRGQLLDQLL